MQADSGRTRRAATAVIYGSVGAGAASKVSTELRRINCCASPTGARSQVSQSAGSSATTERLSCRSGPSFGSGLCMRFMSGVRVGVEREHGVRLHQLAALGALVNAGADVRTISVYAIHHDKVIIADRQTVEQGSFNYSDAAAHRNSENVLVNWGNPKLAEVYLKHFERNYYQAAPFQSAY